VYGEFSDNNVNRVEFADINHLAMLYARVKVASKEFSYEPFNGMIYGVQIFYGQGFVSDIDTFKTTIFSQNSPKPNVKIPRQINEIVLKDPVDMSSAEHKDPVALHYEKFAGVE